MADSFGATVKQRREALEMSMRQLAELAGISRRFLSYIETGNVKGANPSIDTVAGLARILGPEIWVAVLRDQLIDWRATMEIKTPVAVGGSPKRVSVKAAA